MATLPRPRNPFGYSEYTYETIKTGEVQGSATAAQFPNITGCLMMIKAVASNAGNVYIGAAGVTKVDGTTDVTSGWELDAGEETGWLPISSLASLYYICDNAGDDMVYVVLDV